MAEAVAEEYKSSLSDLNFNSKPHINMLTMLAEDNIKYAPQIVQAIADHIQSVPSEIKLPGLYLVDSIIKNVGKQYLSLFSQNLVTLFSCVFEKVEENTRSLLYKLRQTWNDILPNKILYAVDVRVQKLDPAWPVTAQAPAQSIHINPKFLGSNTQNSADTSLVKKEDHTSQQGEVLKQLVAKKKELEAKQEQLRILKQKKLLMAGGEAPLDQTSVPKVANLKLPFVDPRAIARINPNIAHRDPRLQKINAPKICETPALVKSPKFPVSPVNVPSVAIVPKAKELPTVPVINNVTNVQNLVPVESIAAKDSVNNTELPSKNSSEKSPKIVPSKINDEPLPSVNNLSEKPKIDAPKNFVIPIKKDDSSNKVQAEKPVVSTETEKSPKPSKDFKEKSPRYSRSPEGKSKSSRYSRNQCKNDAPKKASRPRSRSPIHKSEKYKSKNDVQYEKEKHSKKIGDKDYSEKEKNTESSSRDQVSRGKGKREQPNNDGSKENSCAPPVKKVKADLPDDHSKNEELFGKEDQDYRQISKGQSGGNPKGWAQYKESHPDEYKSPLRPARNNMDSKESFPEKMNREFSNVRTNDGFYPPEYDRLGRPRLPRGRDQRFHGRRGFYPRGRGGRFDPPFHPGEQYKDPLASMVLTDPEVILQQAEAKFRLGRISENEYLDLRRDLEVMLQSEEFRRLRDQTYRMQQPERFRMHGNHPGNEKPFDSGPFYQGEPLKIQGPRMPPPEIRSFKLDSKMRTIHFVDEKALVIMDNDEPRELTFKGEPRLVFVEGLNDGIPLGFDGQSVEFELDGKRHLMRFGAPSREIYIDNHPYEAKFGGPPLAAMLEEGRVYKIRLGGPPPQVVVGDKPQFELFAKFRGHGVPPHQPLENDLDSQRRLGQPGGNLPYDVDMRMGDDAGRKPDGYDDDMKDVDWRHRPPTKSGDDAKYFKPVFQPEPWDQNMPAPMNRNFHEQNPQGWKSSPNFPSDKPPLLSHDWETLKPPPFPRLNGSPHNTPPRDKEWEHQKPYDSPDRMDWRGNDYPHDGPPALLPHPDQRHLYEKQRNSPISMEEDPSRYHDGPRDVQRPNITPSLRPQFDDRPKMRPRAPAPQFGTWQRPNFRERGPSTSTGPNLLPPPLPPFQAKPSLLGDGPKPLLEPPPAFPDLGPVAESISERVLRATTAPVTLDSSGALTSQTDTPSSESAPVTATATAATPLNIDVGTLFQKLVAAGIINSEKEEKSEKKEKKKEKDAKEKEKENKDNDNLDEEPIPPIQLKLSSLRQHHSGVSSALYRGSQCASCGMRFKEIQSEHYSRHLDWHFRMNRREKDGVKKAFSRRWYYEVEDWNQFEEFEDFEERAPSYFELQTDGTQMQTEEPVDVPSIPALGQETEVCVVCGEPFQLFWVEEEEEWHLRDAVRHESQAYHPACYEDHKKASQAVETPTEDTKVVIKQEPPDYEEQAIADVSDALEEIKVKTEEEVEAMKVEETDAVKEAEAVKDDETLEVEEFCTEETKVKEEPPEDILEGKPGEEEIIGLISESDMELEDAKAEEPKDESKMVVQSGGGIVLKIKAESMQPQSPAGTNDKAEKEEPNNVAQDSDEEEFRPPTPDPRFQVLPPVKKGTELSGLCCIM